MLRKILSHRELWILLLLSLGLRLYELGLQSYWIDEMVSVYFCSRDSWRDLFLDNHPILYHFILKIWIGLWGTTEFATRFLSVIFSVATTGAIYLLAQKITKKKIWGVVAGFLHAISAFSIIYAQETRMYAQFELATAVNLYFFFEAFFENKKSLKHFYISCIFLAFTHYGALLVFAFEAFFILGTKGKNIKSVSMALAGGLAVAIMSYLINFSWFHLEWQKFKYQKEVAAQLPIEALLHLSGLSVLALLLYLAFFILVFWQIHKNSAQKKIFYFFAGLIFFSITDLQIAADLTKRSLLLPRYLIFLNPAWILLFTFGLSCLEKKRAWMWGGVIIGLLLLFIPKTYFEVKAPWRDMASKLLEMDSHPRVFTTRTLAIGSPYLEKKGIGVQRLNEQKAEQIKVDVKKFKTVWIMENYWGAAAYYEELEKELDQGGIETTRFQFQNKYSEPLQLLKITSKK